jgi:hypothetical protein
MINEYPISRKHLPKNEDWRFPFLEKIYWEMRNNYPISQKHLLKTFPPNICGITADFLMEIVYDNLSIGKLI